MVSSIRYFLRLDQFKNQERIQLANFLGIIAFVGIITIILRFFSYFFFLPPSPNEIIPNLIVLVTCIVVLWLIRRHSLTMPGILLPLVVVFVISYSLYVGSGVNSYQVTTYVAAIIVAGLALRQRGIIIFTGLILILITALFIVERNGLTPLPREVLPTVSDLIGIYMNIWVSSLLISILVYSFSSNLAVIQQNATDLVENNQQLQATQSSLQIEIAERKQAETTLQQTNLKLQRRATELATLNHMTQTLVTTRDLATALKSMAQSVGQLFKVGSVEVMLLAPDQINVTVMAEYLEHSEFSRVGKSLPVVAQTPVARVVETEKILLVSDIDDKSKSITASSQTWLQMRRARSAMIAPLLSRGEVIGLISVESDQPARHFTPAEMNLLETVAGQMAGAIENGRLLEQAQSQQEIAESLRQVGDILSSSLDQKVV
ncbi:MAG: GAF domain-containing protein, partial [Chloroflexota bacterium]